MPFRHGLIYLLKRIFEGVGASAGKPPSVMNEIRICLPYKNDIIKELWRNYVGCLKKE